MYGIYFGEKKVERLRLPLHLMQFPVKIWKRITPVFSENENFRRDFASGRKCG